jgi:outer membrane protein OmpA-like peptidoglycan-associated protein
VGALVLPGCGSKRRAANAEPVPEPKSQNGIRIKQINNGTQITGDESLLFDSGKATIKPGGLLFLDKLARALRDKPQANVLVEGHTDNVGSAQLNDSLSERRALAVRQALIDRNIAASRMSARGLGMSKPIADNGTPEGRATNRRTEIFVIGESISSLD